MKLVYRIVCVLIFLCAVSCTKEKLVNDDPSLPDELVPVEVEASFENTKTTVSGVKTTWVKGDKISVIDGKGGIYTLTATTSGATTTFKGEISASATQIGAIYPYTTDATLNPNNNLVISKTFVPRECM